MIDFERFCEGNIQASEDEETLAVEFDIGWQIWRLS